MTATICTKDFLGRSLVGNDSPGTSDVTDYLGRSVVDTATFPPVPGDETDYLGRALTGAPGPG